MTVYRFVQVLPDLISPEEYGNDPNGRLLRFRVRATPDGVEILGDCPCPEPLERILEALRAKAIDQMLCG